MPEFALAAVSALDGYSQDFDGAVLREVTDLEIVSVAVPIAGQKKLAAKIKSAYGCAVPKPTTTTQSKDGLVRLVSTQADQFLLLFDTATPDGGDKVAARLNTAGYITDQTDNWAVLRLSGPNSRTALERICPVDLHPDVFALNASARTHMEHLGVLVIRTEADAFLLLSARSSAKSFLHAVVVSVKNVT